MRVLHISNSLNILILFSFLSDRTTTEDSKPLHSPKLLTAPASFACSLFRKEVIYFSLYLDYSVARLRLVF